MAKLMGSPTSNFTFRYQKGAKNTSLVDLLLSKGIVDNHSLHKVFHSFPKVVPNEKTFITIRVAIVNNIELIIQMGGHIPKMVLLDIGAQPMILRVQFNKNIGMFNSKLRKSMWEICTANGSVKEVLGESSNLIAFNFNEGTN
jgi:hypothetical protein